MLISSPVRTTIDGGLVEEARDVLNGREGLRSDLESWSRCGVGPKVSSIKFDPIDFFRSRALDFGAPFFDIPDCKSVGRVTGR